MSETCTVRDFLNECSAYPYSKTNYDIVREACELKLMKHWLESNAYLKEHQEMLESYEGMFAESTDDQVALVEAAYNDRFAALVNKIASGLKKFIQKAIRVLHIIGSKLKGQDKNLKAFKKFVIDDEMLGKIFDVTKDDMKDKEFNRLTILVKDLGIKFADDVNADDKKLAQLIFYVAYSDDIKLEPLLPLKNPINIGKQKFSNKPIFPEDYIVKLCEKALNSSTSDGAKEFRHELNEMMVTGVKDLSFYMKDDYNVRKTIEALTNVQRKCDDAKWEGFEAMEELNLNLSTVYELAGTTLSVLTALINVRVDLQVALSTLVKNNEGGKDNA